jgi:DNA repair protein RecO (recombination protein O)
MDWSDRGVVIRVHKHGETSAIVTLLTEEHGRHAGLVRGGAGKRKSPILQPGNLLQVNWRARLEDQLGTYTCEMERAFASSVLDDAARLAALSSYCAIADATLPERVAEPGMFEALVRLLESLPGTSWQSEYVKWELYLLSELGYGLDFSCCASTGQVDDLIYVSPKSGRAVSREAGEPYKLKLLPLPKFLFGGGISEHQSSILDGLVLTGYFLSQFMAEHRNTSLPDARDRLINILSKKGRGEG